MYNVYVYNTDKFHMQISGIEPGIPHDPLWWTYCYPIRYCRLWVVFFQISECNSETCENMKQILIFFYLRVDLFDTKYTLLNCSIY